MLTLSLERDPREAGNAPLSQSVDDHRKLTLPGGVIVEN